jgi:hypothetical protein
MKIEFWGKQSDRKFNLQKSACFNEYDSLFSLFGYYKNRYIYEIPPIEKQHNETYYEYPLTQLFDRQQQKTIIACNGNEVAISKKSMTVECNGVKIQLKPDRVTKIVIEKNKPLIITVQDGWIFDPPITRLGIDDK